MMRAAIDVEHNVQELARWRARKPDDRIRVAHKIAREAAAKDRSDPFARDRILSHLGQNVHCPNDLPSR